MKKIILIALLLFCYNLYSQDTEPTPYDLIWGDSPTARPMQVDSFNIDGIKLGFQWSGSPKMSSALLHNIVHGGNYGIASSTPIRKQKLILQLVRIIFI